jgi:hypothetical protein
MNANLDNIAKELYGKIQTRFPDIQMGDENAAVLSKKEDIPKARFFEFEYQEDGEPLGTVAITLDEDDGVVIQVSGDLVTGNNGRPHHNAFKFIRSFRSFAKDRLLNFDIQNLGKSNLDKRDYHYQAKRKEEPAMEPIMENKLYGSSKMSYQDLGEAQLIIKHTQPVNTELAAGRTMHIEGIWVENAQGERFRYPVKHLNGARAMAEHLKHGGNPYDGIGKHIVSLSEEMAALRKFKGYVSRQDQLSEAMANVTDRVIERIEEIKREVQLLQRTAHYESFAESFEESEEQMLPEELVNDLVDRLTIRTFNEELKGVFQYIAKFIDESDVPVKEINPDELLDEVSDTVEKDADGKVKSWKHEGDWKKSNPKKNPEGKVHNLAGQALKKTKELCPEDAFESAMDRLMEQDDLFSHNEAAQQAAIEKFNSIMGDQGNVLSGDDAVMSLKGVIDNQGLMDELRKASPGLDVRALIQAWVFANRDQFANPAVVSQLNFGEQDIQQEQPPMVPPPAADMAAPAPTPDMAAAPVDPNAIPPAAPAPVAPAPVAEGIMNALRKAKAAGATLETQLDFGHGVKTIAEIIEDCGCAPQDVGYDQEQPQADGLHEMLKYISGFYNKEDGTFPLGGTRIKIKVKKEFDEGAFTNASEDDLIKVIHFIEKKDPSSNEHNSIMKLAGVQHQEPSGHMEMREWHAKDIEARLKSVEEDLPSTDASNPFSGVLNKLQYNGKSISDPDTAKSIAGDFTGTMRDQMNKVDAPDQEVMPGFNPGKLLGGIKSQMNTATPNLEDALSKLFQQAQFK